MVVAVEVLGPLRLRIDGRDRPLPGRRERLVLGLLATPPGRHASDGRLIEELWGAEPPASASNGLQVAVSRRARTPTSWGGRPWPCTAGRRWSASPS